MFRNHLYYTAKPFLPWRLRLALRRWHANRVLRRCGNVWPILQSAGRQPTGWAGWPDDKQFAFVLTHDVESQAGLERVKSLAELEMSLGFRSAFYFIPEGPYRVPPGLIRWLQDNGFEVGVHDLYHDGKLFRTRETFERRANLINRYLREWNSVGFRAGFMLHNLDWFHDLEIEYDASTFDTDPFEPQPDGVGTVFPFFVGKSQVRGQRSVVKGQSSEVRRQKSVLTADRCPLTSGYVELPYTLPQDFTLHYLFGERTTSVWDRKLNWVAQRGGMALVNIHPDYINTADSPSQNGEYPLSWLTNLLRHLESRHSGASWNALPSEVAAHIRSQHQTKRATCPQVPQDAGDGSDQELGPASRTQAGRPRSAQVPASACLV